MAVIIAAESLPKNDEDINVLPLGPADVFAKQAGLVALVDGQFAGYVGALPPTRYRGLEMTKVGSLMVAERVRGCGIASTLVGSLSSRLYFQGQVPYAFCNDSSRGIFENAGFDSASPLELPSRAIGKKAVHAMIFNFEAMQVNAINRAA